VSLLHLIDGAPARVPDQAWIYAPASNRGLALRLAGRLKYRYNDTAWQQLHGEERLVDLERDPGERENLSTIRPADSGPPSSRYRNADGAATVALGSRFATEARTNFADGFVAL